MEKFAYKSARVMAADLLKELETIDPSDRVAFTAVVIDVARGEGAALCLSCVENMLDSLRGEAFDVNGTMQ